MNQLSFLALPSVKKSWEQLLVLASRSRIPSALLLVDQPGGFSLKLVQTFVAYLHCKGSTDRSCGSCEDCRKNQKSLHPDTHFLFPGALSREGSGAAALAKKNWEKWRTALEKTPYMTLTQWQGYLDKPSKNLQISTSATRELLSSLSAAPLQSSLQVVLVWLPEYLHPSAANALLKAVEESFSHTFFFFVSCAEEKILPPLRSRMTPLYMPRFSEEEIRDHLAVDHPLYPKENSSVVAGRVKGGLGKALEIVEDPVYYPALLKLTANWLRNSYAKRWGGLLVDIELFHQKSISEQLEWLTYMMQLLSYVMELKEQFTTLPLLPEEREFCLKLGNTLSNQQLIDLIKMVKKLVMLLQRNAYPRLAFFDITQTVIQILALSRSKK